MDLHKILDSVTDSKRAERIEEKKAKRHAKGRGGAQRRARQLAARRADGPSIEEEECQRFPGYEHPPNDKLSPPPPPPFRLSYGKDLSGGASVWEYRENQSHSTKQDLQSQAYGALSLLQEPLLRSSGPDELQAAAPVPQSALPDAGQCLRSPSHDCPSRSSITPSPLRTAPIGIRHPDEKKNSVADVQQASGENIDGSSGERPDEREEGGMHIGVNVQDFLLYNYCDTERSWDKIYELTNMLPGIRMRKNEFDMVSSVFLNKEFTIPLFDQEGRFLFGSETDLSPRFAKVCIAHMSKGEDMPIVSFILAYPERAQFYEWVDEELRKYSKSLVIFRRQQLKEQQDRRCSPTLDAGEHLRSPAHRQHYSYSKISLPPFPTLLTPLRCLAHRARARYRKYFTELNDYTLYRHVDKLESFEIIVPLASKQFGEKIELSAKGLLQQWIRLQSQIPLCDEDGLFVYETDAHLEPKYVSPLVVQQIAGRRGDGLIMRYPERAMEYDWVDEADKEEAAVLAGKRRQQREELKKIWCDLGLIMVGSPPPDDGIARTTLRRVPIASVYKKRVNFHPPPASKEYDFVLYEYTNKRRKWPAIFSRYSDHFEEVKTINGIQKMLQRIIKDVPDCTADGRLIYTSDNSLKVKRTILTMKILKHSRGQKLRGLILLYPERALGYSWVDDADVREARRLVNIRNQQHAERVRKGAK